MRILFLASWFPSRVHPTHGNFVAKHARLVAREHDLVVLNVQDDPDLAVGKTEMVVRQEEGYQLHQLYYGQSEKTASWRKLWLRWRAWDALRRTYDQNHQRPDILHAHVLLDAGIYAAWLGRKWSIPFVLTEHSTAYWSLDALPGLRGWLGRWACGRAAKILPVTPALGAAMRSQGLQGNYGSVSNVVDADLFRYAPVPPRPPFIFLHVSNFRDWHKNVSGLIRAFLAARERCPQQMVLHLAGDGDLDYRSSKANGLPEGIKLSGPMTEIGVAQTMRERHAFVLFSNVENQPVVLLEALCCGRPCIATDVGGIADILDESNGLIISPKDEAELTEAMLRMVENYEHYQQEKISAAAAARYGESAVLNAFENAYQKAVAG